MADTPDDLVWRLRGWAGVHRMTGNSETLSCRFAVEAADRIEALEAAAGQLLQVQDGLPMTGLEATRRAEAVRALLKDTSHE